MSVPLLDFHVETRPAMWRRGNEAGFGNWRSCIVLDTQALGDAVDASFVDAFRRLAQRDRGFVARFGSVEVVATGLPVGSFNPIFALASWG